MLNILLTPHSITKSSIYLGYVILKITLNTTRPKQMATPVTSNCRPIILWYILSPWSYTALLPPWFSWVPLGLCDLLLHTGPNVNFLFYSNDSRSLQIHNPWVLESLLHNCLCPLNYSNHWVSSRHLQQLALQVQIENLAHHHWLSWLMTQSRVHHLEHFPQNLPLLHFLARATSMHPVI